VGISTARHWVKVYDETGDVQEIIRSGRPKSTSSKEDEVIKNLVISQPESSTANVSTELKSIGIIVSASTIRRRLASSGIVYSRPISKPLLSKNHRIQRLRFARRNKNTDWNKVLFTDESTFQLFANPEKLWMHRRKKPYLRKVKHPGKIHVWGAFSRDGFGDLVLFTGKLNGPKMVDIYKTGLVNSYKWLFDGDWTLQEDNDPKHTSKIAKKWKEENLIDRMEWPSNSPDLNPIENLWRIMKVQVRKYRPQNLKQLKVAIMLSWRSLPKNLAQNLVDSMPNRIKKLQEVQGDSIDY
jgi:transposase